MIYTLVKNIVAKNQDAYWKGAEAYDEGLNVDKNPYVRDTDKWVAWRAGWLGFC